MVIINKWYICGMEGEYGYYDDGDSKLVRMDFKSAMEVLLAGGTVTRVGYGVMGRQGGQGLRFNVSKLLVFKDGIIRNTDVMGPQGAYEWTIMREDTLATDWVEIK